MVTPMKKPCKNCPFRIENDWHWGAEGKILALEQVDRQQIFSCHELHPDTNVFSLKDMKDNDCAGFRMMKENMISPDIHPGIVNNFNETGPDFDLKYWAEKSGYKSNMLNHPHP